MIRETLEKERQEIAEKEFEKHQIEQDKQYGDLKNDEARQRYRNDFIERRLQEMEEEHQKQLEIERKLEEMESEYDEDGEKIDPIMLIEMEEQRKLEQEIRREL